MELFQKLSLLFVGLLILSIFTAITHQEYVTYKKDVGSDNTYYIDFYYNRSIYLSIFSDIYGVIILNCHLENNSVTMYIDRAVLDLNDTEYYPITLQIYNITYVNNDLTDFYFTLTNIYKSFCSIKIRCIVWKMIEDERTDIWWWNWVI